MYATGGGGGGGRGFFFQRLGFLYPPQGPYKFSEPPQAISRKMNTPPSPLTRNVAGDKAAADDDIDNDVGD